MREDVFAYTNPRVLQRFKQMHPLHKDNAESLFADLLKYLWLCYKHESDKLQNPQDKNLDFVCVMHEEMRMIDEMWHAFLLFTQDYAEFCQSYFGRFIHHVPNVVEDQPVVVTDFENQTRLFLTFVYDQLGEDTVCRWFAEHLKTSPSG